MSDSTIKKLPFFSIVMPAYNAGPFIGEAIESVLAQSFDDWELVIVDDCSTDNTRDIASRYAGCHNNIRLCKRDSNSGSAYTPRKEAIVLSEGRYIVPLDADDAFEACFLEKIYSRIADTGAEAVYCRLVHGDMILPVQGFDISAVYKGRDLLQHTIGGWKIAPNGCVERRLYVDTMKKYAAAGNCMNDDELLSRQLMIAAPKIAFCDAEYRYRVNPDSVSCKISHSRFDILYTDIRLKELIYDNYISGDESRTLINVQLFNDTAGMISFMMKHRDCLRGHEVEINSLIERARCSIDWQLIEGKVSRIKSILLRIGIGPLKFAMMVYGSVKGRK